MAQRRAVLLALMVALALSRAGGALAQEAGFRQRAGEFWVYLSVMPVEVLSGPGAPRPPGATPYRTPALRDTHHVMVSIYDYRAGRRIEEATVAARVAELGFSGVKKTLEPASVEGEKVYVGAFPMLDRRGPYRIDIQFRLPGVKDLRKATFYFAHPSFAPPKQAKKR